MLTDDERKTIEESAALAAAVGDGSLAAKLRALAAPRVATVGGLPPISDDAQALIDGLVEANRPPAGKRRTIATAAPATVGGLLASSPVVEWFAAPDWWQMRFTTAGVETRWRHPRALTWAPWARRGSMKPRMGFAARVVAAAECDVNPATRGPIGEG
jgi:hypothetical protein